MIASKKPRVCAIIPAFNEGLSIEAVVRDIENHQPDLEIVIVDDGSRDDTYRISLALGHTVLRLPVNLGIGGAVQTGLIYARDHGFDCAVQFDGDGQHRAEELNKILSPAIDGGADAVIGSRFCGGGDYRATLPRLFGIRILGWAASLLAGQRITDSTSGFRAYNRKAITFLARVYPQDYPEPEAVIDLTRNGFRVKEVPVTMVERTGGKSSIGAWGSLFYMVKVLLAIMVAATRKPVTREHE